MSNGGRTIAEFLDALATDPELEYRFSENAIEVMDRFGLTREQRQLILGGRVGEIREAIVQEQETDSPAPVVYMIKMK